ncbi:MAG TPA: flagellar basal-body MS-ring/collar protein FliF [Vicinamibacterales bacterium]|nr:flagellar basal-body MS-ring/collar protein FliF [Vicinamibacterales bacterium]
MDFQQLLDKLTSLGGAMTRTQLATLGVAFVLVVAVVGGSTWWLNSTDYALLFSDMDSETASQVVSKLKSLKVPYQLDPGGHAIRVANTRVDELRLELTSQGLPASGRIGFEIFDRTAFGATEFLEKVNYRRALEGEIARTIATISEVSSARVHIAMGKDSLFGEPRPAKASVVLKLRGRPLATSTISGISNLVAASVEGLRPEAVVILDSFGRPLARPEENANDPLGAAQLERQQRIERDMSARVVALLAPVVGEDRVRVNVALKLNPNSTEQTEERYDPNTVLRSKQTSSDVASGGQVPALVAGARGNTPPSADPKAPQAGTPAALATLPGSQRNAETSNFEVSRLTRHTVQPPGDIARLSVAVILDDDHVPQKQKDGSTKLTRTPRTREELQKIQGIVAAAVGLDASRGDQLTVENVSFDEPTSEERPTQTNLVEKFTPQVEEVSKVVGVLLVVLFTFLLVVRPMLRKAGLLPEKKRKPSRREREALKAAAKAEAEAAAAAVEAAARAALPGPPKPRTVSDLENEIEAQLEAEHQAKVTENLRLPVLTRRVSTMSLKEPENIAKLLRTWMHEGER